MHLENSEMLQVSSVAFEANEAVAGGAIYTTAVENTPSKLRSCVFQENHAVDGGAVFFSADRADEVVTSSVFRDNLAGKPTVYASSSTMELRIAHVKLD